MLRCDLCDNLQAGGEACDVCGRPFAGPRPASPPVDVVEGYEPTASDPVQVGPDAVEGLEPTGSDPVEVLAGMVEEFESTAAPALPGTGGAAPGPLACRYCGEAAGPGLFCERCGMRLPLVTRPAGEGQAAGGEGGGVRCRNCAIPVRGTSCPACGTRVAP